jgi:hypothetical protein
MLKTLARCILSWWLPVGSTMNTWQELLEPASSSSPTCHTMFYRVERVVVIFSVEMGG